jgi:hypothetical protein
MARHWRWIQGATMVSVRSESRKKALTKRRRPSPDRSQRGVGVGVRVRVGVIAGLGRLGESRSFR